ncbi:hypothetical protein F503_02485 [Ophiostoma piceae UAMH 11346]|uniref:M-phase inducer phosphatase n=1 Tax=Ophiostoma piceae (strain UAMH 11346) TaxID=1262450 RepID=S3C0U0_OPHP1|nr:hypothetical protein F503_02485 [Ophiostoma piceae UAMH 11346]
MEASSPLAAMHRPSAPPFGRRDLFTNLHVRLSPGKPSRGVGRLGGSGIFSIRDQYNQESYGPIHGSSPAGSLAADLCQNFSIGEDGSPRFPTPRRALFTSCHTSSNMSSNRGSSFLKRPPMPVPSSPLPIEALMEMTPVPKKTAPSRFSVPVAGIDMSSFESPASPSPNIDMMMMLESPCPSSQPQLPQQREQEQQREAQAQAQTQALPPPPAFEPPARPLSSASAFERRKLPRRASLTRAKGYSFAGVPARTHSADNQLPLFKFGESRPPLTQTSSSLSISECFQESPPQPAAASSVTDSAGSSQLPDERRPQTSDSPCPNPSSGSGLHGPIRFRPPFASTSSSSSASSSRSGSPIGHIRRPSSSFVRPRRQYRRSLSMFENPIDMMRPKRGDDNAGPGPSGLQPSLLASVMDTDEPAPSGPALPHFFPAGQNDSIPRINRETLLSVLDGQYNDTFENKLIIDCRFEYEYEGGHINEAINYNDKDLLAKHLFNTPMDGRTLIVLHCEYSAHRAPLMARHLRAEDRTANAEHYPRLTYPELYILDGGYSGFFTEHPCRCYPQAYVEMDAAEHAYTCEREMGRLKQARKGLHRAQTFAFGQHNESPSANHGSGNNGLGDKNTHRSIYEFNDVSSPIAPGRSVSSVPSPSMMMGASPILGCDRGFPRRRMASY